MSYILPVDDYTTQSLVENCELRDRAARVEYLLSLGLMDEREALAEVTTILKQVVEDLTELAEYAQQNDISENVLYVDGLTEISIPTGLGWEVTAFVNDYDADALADHDFGKAVPRYDNA